MLLTYMSKLSIKQLNCIILLTLDRMIQINQWFEHIRSFFLVSKLRLCRVNNLFVNKFL